MDSKINTREILEQTLPEFFEPAEEYKNINKQLLFEIFTPPDAELKNKGLGFIALWSSFLNYEYYSEIFFPDMVFERSQSDDIISKYPDISVDKNHFTKSEIKILNESISKLKELLRSYGFPAYLQAIRGFLNNGKLEPENEIFINKLKNEDMEPSVMFPLIKNRLAEIGKMDLFYILSIIYVDLYKIHQFLLGELDPSIPDIDNSDSDSHSDASATQWALYHYVLQKAKIKPWFTEKKKEFLQLEKEYGKHWNNLQTRWNLINNSEGQEGYSKKDLVVVESLLNENYPKAIPKLKEISDKLF